MMNLFKTPKSEIQQVLHPYQIEAIRGINRVFSTMNKALLIMATGTGKTTVFSEYTSRVIRKGKKVLILAHREELIYQAKERLESQCLCEVGIEMAEHHSGGQQIIVGTVQSVSCRLGEFDPNEFALIVIDEAHHCSARSYQKIVEYFLPAKILGVTATPDRSKNSILKIKYFDDIAFNYSLWEGIRDGYLADIECIRTDQVIDMTGLRVKGNDYTIEDLDNLIIPKMGAICDGIIKSNKGLKTLVFTPSVFTARILADEFNKRNIKATSLNGKDNKDYRKAVLRDFEYGNINVLVNCALFTEGLDIPTLPCVALARPTRSRILYSQMVGRGTRRVEGKDKMLLVEMTYNSDDLSLITPSDLFISNNLDKRVVSKVKERLKKEKVVKIFEALDGEREKYFDKKYISNMLYEYRGKYKKFDPFLLFRLAGIAEGSELKSFFNGKALTGSQTKKQKKLLNRLGVDCKNFELTKSQSSTLIDLIVTHKWNVDNVIKYFGGEK